MADSGSNNTSGGADRANLLVLRDGGPFAAGIKGEGGVASHEYKKGLDPTHMVITGGMQEAVLNDFSMGKNPDGLYNRFAVVVTAPKFQSLRKRCCTLYI
jgi:hypothetical protein